MMAERQVDGFALTRPQRFLTRMVLFLLAVALVCVLLIQPLMRAFLANPVLNGLIVTVLIIGIGFTFRQVFTLRRAVDWAEAYRGGAADVAASPPALLAPMATMLRERRGRVTLSALSARSILDSISARLDETRDISRYLIGLLIFLGLLGTFWGLLDTVSAVADTIRDLRVESGADAAQMFTALKRGLEAPLSGMGTAFSSSLLGLSGSLVLGFLDLQAAQAQNRFYNDLEEWFSGFTRLSSGGLLVEGDQPVPAYVTALLEQTADSLENLQRVVARSEENRQANNQSILSLSERLAFLVDQMRAEQELMMRLAEGQRELRPVLDRLASTLEDQRGGLDEASRNHLRNLDVYVLRLLEETTEGRTQLLQDLRAEIKVLARTIAALGRDRALNRRSGD
jgi:hypothetical protein